jgi:Contractile injection system tube protein
MERVAFLVEETGARIDCLLNPETMEVTRLAGVRSRGVASGRLTGAGLADDPLHLTGGGRTELNVDLLFAVDLIPTPGDVADVRALTRPLWELAENSAAQRGAVRPPLVRFLWGKSWNVPGVVAAVAERFDQFDEAGVPLRSWLRMRFVRVAESAAEAQATYEQMLAEQQNQQAQDALDATAAGATPPSSVVAVGEGDPAPGAPPPATRFDLLAHDGLGSPFLWRLLAAYNEVPDPLRVDPGTVLAVPPPVAGGAGYVPGNAPPPPPPPPTLPSVPEEL